MTNDPFSIFILCSTINDQNPKTYFHLSSFLVGIEDFDLLV